VRRLFISYARANKRDVDQLVGQLEMMGYETWVDFKLRGGQQWWDEVLQRIADTDVFIAVLSRAALNSTACRREFDWAEALNRPILPVAVESLPVALPRRFAERQIIDYSHVDQRPQAALLIQGGLSTIASAPALPDPLPERPGAPLSYLTDLIDLITQPAHIDHERQHQVLQQIRAALRSVDPEERRGGQDILDRFASRSDLYADVDHAITGLRDSARVEVPPAQRVPATPATPATSSGRGPGPPPPVHSEPRTHIAPVDDDSRPERSPVEKPWWQRGERLAFAGTLGVAFIAIVAITIVVVMSNGNRDAASGPATSASSTVPSDELTSLTEPPPPPPVEAPVSSSCPSSGSVAAPSLNAPETPTAASPGQVTFAVTGTKAPGDIITVTYTDASGRQRTQRNVYIPWCLTVTPISQSSVGSVQASSLFLLSKLNCSITTQDGTVVSQKSDNASEVSC